MAKGILPTVPFPADEDRDDFGKWLTGFTDGEGCFHLGWVIHKRFRPSPTATFVISLRRDDQTILEKIQSFLQCGRLYLSRRTLNGKKHFVTIFSTQTAADLASVIVPHFDRYPLQSKKRADFVIWKEAILLLASRDRRGRGSDGTYSLGWTDEELSRFGTLHDSIKAQRKFTPPLE